MNIVNSIFYISPDLSDRVADRHFKLNFKSLHSLFPGQKARENLHSQTFQREKCPVSYLLFKMMFCFFLIIVGQSKHICFRFSAVVARFLIQSIRQWLLLLSYFSLTNKCHCLALQLLLIQWEKCLSLEQTCRDKKKHPLSCNPVHSFSESTNCLSTALWWASIDSFSLFTKKSTCSGSLEKYCFQTLM